MLNSSFFSHDWIERLDRRIEAKRRVLLAFFAGQAPRLCGYIDALLAANEAGKKLPSTQVILQYMRDFKDNPLLAVENSHLWNVLLRLWMDDFDYAFATFLTRAGIPHLDLTPEHMEHFIAGRNGAMSGINLDTVREVNAYLQCNVQPNHSRAEIVGLVRHYFALFVSRRASSLATFETHIALQSGRAAAVQFYTAAENPKRKKAWFKSLRDKAGWG